ncbi:MAG: hypothetical protein B6242_17425 [Anaerolineaceae bacterium 4572_78]|nr:MAG: hypothetical protein B6242_17425 [Anaerolineaceae bacterium 4572_78]
MHEKNHKNKTFAWDIIGIAIGSMLFFLWHSMHLYGLRWDYDEGAYLASAQLLWHGYELYGEVYATHPPIFFYTLALAFLSPANVLWFGRFIIVLHATIGLIATSLIARRIGAKWHGLTCLIILALQPQIFRNARLINGNVPSLSIAMLALWASLEFYHTGKNRWLVMAGISMAWAIGIKFLVLYLTPLPILLIALRAIHHEKEFFACAKTIIKNSFAWGIIVVMTFFIIILPFDKT